VPRRRIVLLVEPDPVTRSEFERALAVRGFQVWTAANGPQALELARAELPGVIVGDFPLAAGAAFTGTIRTEKALRSTVIITVTDRQLTEKDSDAWQQSDRVLSKPIDAERLAEEVSWAVDRRVPVGD
jgi:CheY-like chemotaxis protein